MIPIDVTQGMGPCDVTVLEKKELILGAGRVLPSNAFN